MSDINYAEKYGIAPTNDPLDTLARLFVVLEGSLNLQDELAESNESGKGEMRAEAKKQTKKDPDTAKVLKDAVSTIRQVLFDSVDHFPIIATEIIEHLRFLIDQVEDVEACVFAEMSRSSKKPAVSSKELVEARNLAEWAKENVTKMFTVLPMFGVDIKKDAPWFPVKENKNGEIVPALRNLKSGPRENAGRDAAVKRFSYTINGNEIPAGISMNEVAVRYCSTLSDRINGKMLKEKIDKVNEGKSLKETESFDVKVPAGILHAEIVSDDK